MPNIIITKHYITQHEILVNVKYIEDIKQSMQTSGR